MGRYAVSVAIFCAIFTATSQAADYSRQVASGDWSVGSNWGGTGANLPIVNAYIANGGTAIVSSSGQGCSYLTLGTSAGAGTLQLLGGSFRAANQYIGYSGTGTFTQSGGTNNNFSILLLAYNVGSYGEYDLSGNALLAGYPETIGGHGSGVFVQSGGTNSDSDDLNVGSFGTGLYSLNGGFLSVGAFLTVGDSSGSGAFTLSESGRISAKFEKVGGGGHGEFTQSAGTNTCTTFYIAELFRPNPDVYNLNGGLLSVAALIKQSGNAQFNFNGGTLQAGASFGTVLPMTLGTSGGGATIDTQSFSVTQSGSLSGSGGLAKVGSGALILAGSNTYSGLTDVQQGQLIVNGPFVGPVTVDSGGTLAGTGNLASVTIGAGAHLSPGSAPGTLKLSGSLTLLSGAGLDFDLAAPGGSDEVSMPAGTLLLSNQQFSDFHFTPLPGFVDGSYTLIDAGSISGSLGGNVSGTINGHLATLGIQGNDVVLTVVPEPSTIAMGLAASLFVAALSRHRILHLSSPAVSPATLGGEGENQPARLQ
jgi:autotransporter-associated beta strand protein